MTRLVRVCQVVLRLACGGVRTCLMTVNAFAHSRLFLAYYVHRLPQVYQGQAADARSVL